MRSDQQKDGEMEQESAKIAEDHAHQDELLSKMIEKRNELPQEIDEEEEHVFIAVRHPHEGRKTRRFRSDDTFAAVLLWVGSLAAEPEHLALREFGGNEVNPNEKVFSGTFYVVEQVKNSEGQTPVARAPLEELEPSSDIPPTETAPPARNLRERRPVDYGEDKEDQACEGK